MLLTLGLDSQFALMETVTTAILDAFPALRNYKLWVVLAAAVFGYAGGIIFTTNVSLQKRKIVLYILFPNNYYYYYIRFLQFKKHFTKRFSSFYRIFSNCSLFKKCVKLDFCRCMEQHKKIFKNFFFNRII